MIKEKLVFNDKKVAIASEFLGVSEAYLRDETRPFNPGDKIPEDVLIERTPTPITTTPSDLTEMARIFERQAADIKKSKEELRDTEFNAMKEMQRQMAELLQEVSGNTRVMSANVLALAEIVKELKEERGGEHDPDL